MSFNPLVLVVGMNLLEQEIMDEDKIAQMEASIVSCVSPYISSGPMIPSGMTENELIFHFSRDPSVTSEGIPVVFRVTILPSDRIHLEWLDRAKMAGNIKKQLQDILPNRPKMLVMVEDTEGGKAGVAPLPACHLLTSKV